MASSSSQQTEMPHYPYQFNAISEVEYHENSLDAYDIEGPKETYGVTVEQLAEARVSSIMGQYCSPLSAPQRDALRVFLDCVVSSIYRFTYRKPHSPSCTSISAAIECIPYTDCWRDTIRVKFTDPMGNPQDPRIQPMGQSDLALIWALAAHRAEKVHNTTDVLPTNIALDIGLNSPYAAISVLGPEDLGKFNLRDVMTAVNNVVELGEFHPDPPFSLLPITNQDQ